MNRSSSLTVVAVAGACAIALAVPSVVPRLAEEWSPATSPVPATTTPTATPASQPAPGTETDPSDALSRGVVLVTATTPAGRGAGTGMVLTASGQVLTNYHVVEGSTSLEVTVADTGRTYAATVVGYDSSRDVALLQVAGASGLATVTPDDERLNVGDALTAVGNASGGGELVASTGVVTALGQEVRVNDGSDTETLTGVIETNAGAVPGDSGGPMFDAEGEVAGMTTAGGQTVTAARARGRRGAGVITTVSYAVPISTALSVVQQIRSGAESGTVEIGPRPYLGVAVGSESLVVSSVVSGSPAAQAGVTAGSTITSVGGVAVTTHDELSAALSRLEPGQRVTLVWIGGDGARHSASVTLGESPLN